MNLYKLSQTAVSGYDTYDSVVVAAETETEARQISPCGTTQPGWWRGIEWPEDLSLVQVEFIGIAVGGLPAGVVLASFNAG